ncbi:MAG: hypothetical protein C0617_09360 [Desulfuromonas sp.]|uniref:hypothetical protein n=1 Tax=Desulfuromonas sp. TaxID=892 RepID=UPI000CA77FFE|nr:hypothetical protein [Desulfuromonas sp.]PLX84022.1 MAG: hypothetical protein C0617_09360 [Desulfuromonas sp.]
MVRMFLQWIGIAAAMAAWGKIGWMLLAETEGFWALMAFIYATGFAVIAVVAWKPRKPAE